MSYRGFTIVERGRSFLAERPLEGQKAIYRISGKTLAEIKDRIDQWVWDRLIGEILL